jgi:hypothetical protein
MLARAATEIKHEQMLSKKSGKKEENLGKLFKENYHLGRIRSHDP